MSKSEPFTNTTLDNIFVSDPKAGRAFYKMDKEFYINLADGEIRTITLSWIDKTRLTNNPDYKKGNALLKDRVAAIDYTDNQDYYLSYFYKNFDWKKLQEVLGN